MVEINNIRHVVDTIANEKNSILSVTTTGWMQKKS